MKANHAASLAARLIGLLAAGWAYLAVLDLRWLLHLHMVHEYITHAPFTFDYDRYFAVTIVNVAAAILAAGALLLCPGLLLRVFTPGVRSGRTLSAGWVAVGIGLGLLLVVYSVHGLLATALWTVYSSGRNAGWQMDLAVSAAIAVGGVVVCRGVLGARGEA